MFIVTCFTVSLYFSINTAWLQLPSSQHGWKTQDYITQEHIRTSGLSKSVYSMPALKIVTHTLQLRIDMSHHCYISTWPSVLFLVQFNNSDWIWLLLELHALTQGEAAHFYALLLHTLHPQYTTCIPQGCPSYVDVMVLNRSCPAVSQICSFTFSPFTSIVLILKSTPIVVMYVPMKRYGNWIDFRNESVHCLYSVFLQWSNPVPRLLSVKQSHSQATLSLKQSRSQATLLLKQSHSQATLSVKQSHSQATLSVKQSHSQAILSVKQSHSQATL